MDILFATGKLRRIFNEHKLLARRYGPREAELIERRLADLRAARTLEVLHSLPQHRCHELRGDLAGRLSIDLVHPYRLIIEPADEPRPVKPDGGLDWSRVTRIMIVGVEDTHD